MARLIKIKEGASLVGIKYPMRRALKEIDKLFEYYDVITEVTCGPEGEHTPASYHPFGYALDFGLQGLNKDNLNHIKDELKETLEMYYDVVIESDHIHVEFDVERFRNNNDCNELGFELIM